MDSRSSTLKLSARLQAELTPTRRNRRVHGPPAALYGLARRSRQLAQLTERCTFYERHEIVNRQGEVVERHESGQPFVYRRGQGRVPIDPQDPFLDDGSVVSVSTLGYTDAEGRWHRLVRFQRHPGPDPGQQVEGRERQPALSARQRAEILKGLLQQGLDPVPVAILLREQTLAHRLPPRALTGLVFSERSRMDTVTPLRRRLRAENQARRQTEARSIRRWIRSVGGRVGHHATLYGSLLSAWIPRRHLGALLARPEVVRVELRATDTQVEDGTTTAYLCTNLPTRFNGRDVPGECDPSLDSSGTWVTPSAYLDAINAATGTVAYVDAGYTGLIGGGLANWGHHPLFTHKQEPALTYGIRDPQPMEFQHPAFLWWKRSRFLFQLSADEDTDDDGDGIIDADGDGRTDDGEDLGIEDVEVTPEGDIAGIGPVGDLTESHATRCAGVAMGNLRAGNDPALLTDFSRAARSGVARSVSGLAATAEVQVYEMLDVIGSGYLGEDEDGDPIEGIDAVSSSWKERHGEESPDEAACPSDADARGLDSGSMAIVYAFSNDQVVFAKAGGNDHGLFGGCIHPYEVSPPGASPAALSSSALLTDDMTAAEIQQAGTLSSLSSRTTTPDGRSYPTLACVASTCGCPGTAEDFNGDRDGYEHHGQTSATAPRIAGSALVFKHWYLEQYGSVANTAGHIIVNMLHFADGFARSAPRVREDPPYEGWGMGRFRMRLYSNAQGGTGPTWGTSSHVMWTGRVVPIDIRGGASTLPTGIRHLRITAWWLEVNTGADEAGVNEAKAEIELSLTYRDKAGAWVTDRVASDREHMIRLQYDRDDTHFSCPPSPEGAAESQNPTRGLDKNRGSHYIVGVKKPTFVRRTSWVGVIPRAAAPFQRRGYGPTTRTSPSTRAWCRWSGSRRTNWTSSSACSRW